MPYTFFDVETPNPGNDRMCSIGLVRTDDAGTVQYQEHFLINPEARFHARNIEIHHITNAMVEQAPTFADLWPTLSEVFDGTVLVAHNARFDLSVLAKCLDNYRIPNFDTEYLCTMRLAQMHTVDLPKYTLRSLCNRYGISLAQHHNALADAVACHQVFDALNSDGCDCASYAHSYTWPVLKSGKQISPETYPAMTDLYGLVLGIDADHRLDPRENRALVDWIDRHQQDQDAAGFDEVIPCLREALADGILTFSERDHLFDLTYPYVVDSKSASATRAQQLMIGMLRGVRADDYMNIQEANTLLNWLLSVTPESIPFHQELTDTLREVTEDDAITLEENERLLSLFERLIDPTITQQNNDGIDFPGNGFCLTGDFDHGSKNDIEALIEARGGVIKSSVSKKVRYVVQGGGGSANYAFGSYGGKIKKALELQDKGHEIAILTEDALAAALRL